MHDGFGSQSSFWSKASGESHYRRTMPILTKPRQGREHFGVSSQRSVHDTELTEGLHAEQSDSS
jgi:hypothetical protein